MGKARFSVAFEEGAGGFGPYVVARGRSGPVVRRRPVYRRRSTPEQLAQEARMKVVGAAWGALGAREAQAWAAYAATVERRNPVSGTAYSPTAYNAFSGLALRIVQMDPSAAIPSLPPAGRFAGDVVEVTVGSESGSVRGEAKGANTPSPTVPPAARPSLQGEPSSGEGLLAFRASGPNAPGVVTELLLQRLANVRRTPTAQYKSAAFTAFAEGRPSVTLAVAPGTYACACRFLERSSGRATGLQALGVVTVEPSAA